MWYEQAWSGIVTWGLLCGTLTMSAVFNYVDVGRLHRRHTAFGEKLEMSKRDHRLTGNQYRISGLESIKDA
ncbi:Complex I-MWFE [Aphelenchoides bicaudatus]|nr:Complex I-MWFE [Aphelenchoides bicaudatus]